MKRTEWLDVIINYSGVAQYLKKDTKLFIQGRTKSETFKLTKDDLVYPKIKIRASMIQLYGSANFDAKAGVTAQSVANPPYVYSDIETDFIS